MVEALCTSNVSLEQDSCREEMQIKNQNESRSMDLMVAVSENCNDTKKINLSVQSRRRPRMKWTGYRFTDKQREWCRRRAETIRSQQRLAEIYGFSWSQQSKGNRTEYILEDPQVEKNWYYELRE